MKRFLRLFTAALCANAALMAPGPATAERLSAEDRAEIINVIRLQIEAFQRDDAETAFSLASRGIQETFGTPENFLRMVKLSYQPVYRPASVTFLELSETEGEVVQKVRLTDAGGVAWRALYPMQRQKYGRWRTHGCQLIQISSVSA